MDVRGRKPVSPELRGDPDADILLSIAGQASGRHSDSRLGSLKIDLVFGVLLRVMIGTQLVAALMAAETAFAAQ